MAKYNQHAHFDLQPHKKHDTIYIGRLDSMITITAPAQEGQTKAVDTYIADLERRYRAGLAGVTDTGDITTPDTPETPDIDPALLSTRGTKPPAWMMDETYRTCPDCGTAYRVSEARQGQCPMNCRKTKYRRVYG